MKTPITITEEQINAQLELLNKTIYDQPLIIEDTTVEYPDSFVGYIRADKSIDLVKELHDFFGKKLGGTFKVESIDFEEIEPSSKREEYLKNQGYIHFDVYQLFEGSEELPTELKIINTALDSGELKHDECTYMLNELQEHRFKLSKGLKAYVLADLKYSAPAWLTMAYNMNVYNESEYVQMVNSFGLIRNEAITETKGLTRVKKIK